MSFTLLLHDLFPKDAGLFFGLLVLVQFVLLPLLPGVLFAALAVPVRRRYGVQPLAMLAIGFAVALFVLPSVVGWGSVGGLVGVAAAAVVIHRRITRAPSGPTVREVAAGTGAYVAGAVMGLFVGVPLSSL